MLTFTKQHEDFVEAFASGDMKAAEYDRLLAPKLKATISKYGQARLLLDVTNVKDFSAGALFDEAIEDLRDDHRLIKVAFLGDSSLESIATTLVSPLFEGDVKYFKDRVEAEMWLANMPSARIVIDQSNETWKETNGLPGGEWTGPTRGHRADADLSHQNAAQSSTVLYK